MDKRRRRVLEGRFVVTEIVRMRLRGDGGRRNGFRRCGRMGLAGIELPEVKFAAIKLLDNQCRSGMKSKHDTRGHRGSTFVTYQS